MYSIDISSLKTLPVIISAIGKVWIDSNKIHYFEGEIGSGKTTLVKEIIQYITKKEDIIITSPTYSTYKYYEIPLGGKLIKMIHYDAYNAKFSLYDLIREYKDIDYFFVENKNYVPEEELKKILDLEINSIHWKITDSFSSKNLSIKPIE